MQKTKDYLRGEDTGSQRSSSWWSKDGWQANWWQKRDEVQEDDDVDDFETVHDEVEWEKVEKDSDAYSIALTTASWFSTTEDQGKDFLPSIIQGWLLLMRCAEHVVDVAAAHGQRSCLPFALRGG